MKNAKRFLSLFLLICMSVSCFCGCQTAQQGASTSSTEEELPPFIDFVEQLKLDMDSSTAKMEVTVKLFIDGDTTHFHVPTPTVF